MTSKGNPSRRSGEDTYDLSDDALHVLAERRGLWLGDDLTAIALVASLIDQAERFLPHLCPRHPSQRPHRYEIAHALSTSPDTAQLRFDPETPIANSRWPHEH